MEPTRTVSGPSFLPDQGSVVDLDSEEHGKSKAFDEVWEVKGEERAFNPGPYPTLYQVLHYYWDRWPQIAQQQLSEIECPYRKKNHELYSQNISFSYQYLIT